MRFSLETWDFLMWQETGDFLVGGGPKLIRNNVFSWDMRFYPMGSQQKKDILGKLDIILSIVLYCIVLYCTVLYYILLYCFFILFYFLIQYNNDYTHLDIWTNVFVGTDYSINMFVGTEL